MRDPVSPALARLVEAARTQGRTLLTEPEGLDVVRDLGIAVPHHAVLPAAGTAKALDAVDLDAFPGSRVVLKVVSASLVHKSDAGGVRFLEKDPRAVRRGLADMAAAFAGHPVRGFLLAAFVPHDPSLGGQLLLGMRHTEEFGPVVTFGPGGIHAEFLARNLRPRRGGAIFSPLLASPLLVEAALEQSAVTPAATGRLRGQPSFVTMEDLRDLVLRLLAFAAEAVPEPVLELEINPLVFSPDGPVALDAVVRIAGARESDAVEGPLRPLDKVAKLLQPASIAIQGVSQGSNPGRTILAGVLREGYPKERVTVIKPGVDRIDGCRCVPDVASLPERVDLLVVSVAAEQVPGILEEVVRGERAESVILVAGGLGERRGTEVHVERIRAAIRRARETPWRGPVVNGGNCLGVRSTAGRFDTLFIPEYKLRYPPGEPAPLAVVSQSGAFAVSRASRLGRVNPRTIVTLGNQIDLTVGDYLQVLKDDPAIRVFACYVEGFRRGDGARWLDACRAITSSGRVVVLYRAGRTPAGREATASHTASVAGDYAVTRALAEAAGAVVVETLEDYDDLVRLFVLLGTEPVPGRRLGALSNAGFEVVAMADNLGPFVPATFSDDTHAALERLLARRHLEGIVGVKNLLDLTPIVDDAAYEEAVRLVLADPGVDVGVVGCVPFTGALETVAAGEGHAEDLTKPGSIVSRLARLFRERRKPWVGVVDAGPLYDPMAEVLLAAGVPTFRHADRALRLLGRYVTRGPAAPPMGGSGLRVRVGAPP